MSKPKKRARRDWQVSSDGKPDAEGTQFDELVVGNWLHIEQMDANVFWFGIYGKESHDSHTFAVSLDKHGYRKRVNPMEGFPDDRALQSARFAIAVLKERCAELEKQAEERIVAERSAFLGDINEALGARSSPCGKCYAEGAEWLRSE